MSATVSWTGVAQVRQRMSEYGEAAHGAARQVADYFAPILETAAKENAPWEDRTANARQSLHTFVVELGEDAVILYLSHGVEYGVYLETKYAGRYAIIWPTIQEHLSEISEMLQSIFG